MANFSEENAPYLAKMEEDPYSKAMLDEIRAALAIINKRLSLQVPAQDPYITYFELGMKKALENVLELPDLAKRYLSELPEKDD